MSPTPQALRRDWTQSRAVAGMALRCASISEGFVQMANRLVDAIGEVVRGARRVGEPRIDRWAVKVPRAGMASSRSRAGNSAAHQSSDGRCRCRRAARHGDWTVVKRASTRQPHLRASIGRGVKKKVVITDRSARPKRWRVRRARRLAPAFAVHERMLPPDRGSDRPRDPRRQQVCA
jgi:hypothetical protein